MTASGASAAGTTSCTATTLTIDLTGVSGGSTVPFSVASCNAAIRTGLYATGVNVNNGNKDPVTGTKTFTDVPNVDGASLSGTGGGSFFVTLTELIDPVTSYSDNYTIRLDTSTATGTSTFVMQYGPGSDAFAAQFSLTTASLNVVITGLTPPPPTVTSRSPTSGSTAGGTPVTITGTGFSATAANNTVKFGGVTVPTASITSATTTQLVVNSPAGSVGTVDITVTTANGTSATSANDRFTYVGPTATQAIASKVLTQNQTIAAFTPVTGSGGTAPLTYSISPALPTGLSFNTGSGAITGNPTGTSAAVVYTVTVTDATNATASNTFSLTINSAVVATQAVASKQLTVNRAATAFTPVTGSGGTSTLTYGVSPALPAGLSLASATGAITGTATATSVASNYTVTVTDTNGATATNTFSLTVNAAPVATQVVASKALTVNRAATSFIPVTGSNGTTPLSYSIAPGLPAGLSFASADGTVSGTPTATSGATTYTVTVTDANGATATNTFSLTVNAAVTATQAVATTVLTANRAATAFTPVTGGGGTTPLSYTVAPALPAGLALASATGQITGTPTTASPATTYTVTVTDANAATATATFSLTVNSAVTATQAVATTILTANRAATAFTPVTGGGGTTPLAYSVSPGLPAGLALASATGAITGTPTAASPATTYTVTVTDANNATATATFSLTVNSAVTATQAVASKILTANAAATSFTPVTGGGGTTPLVYSIAPGLPTGLTLASATGAITGTPTAASAATTYTVTVTDANSATASNTFSLTVNSAVVATQAVASKTLTANTAAASFTPVTGSGGTGALAYSISPALPTGLTLASANGAITGTPTTSSAAATYTVTVTDTNNATASNTFSLTINGPVSATQAVASKILTVNKATTSFTPVTGAGGSGALAYSVAPALPAGLTLASTTGAITGTPTAVSPATTYTVTVTDANNATASNTFSLTVNSAPVATQAVATKILTANQATTAFTPVTGTGGTSPLVYSIAPALPTGLTLASASGAITGTPTATSAATTYTVTVTDANNATATNTFSLTVNGAVTATQAVASRMLTINRAATTFTPVTGAGGTGALTYGVSPALPAGLAFNTTTGAVSGTPTVTSATATYTVTVTDTNNATASNTFSLTVNGAVTATQAIATKILTANKATAAFTPVTGAGGTPPLTYSVSPALPAGLSLATASGTITGTPTAASPATVYTVTVTDANSTTASATFSLTVNGAVTATQAVASTVLTANRAATPFTPVTAAGGTSPLSYSVSPALPTGLSFATATGAVSGTPTGASPATTYTVTATDANAATASATFSLTVNGALVATQAVASTTLVVNRAAAPFTPVTGSGGTAPLSFAVAPALPAGLSLATATGVVSGTPTIVSPATNYTVTITDANSATAAAVFSLTISNPPPPPTVTSIAPNTGSATGGTSVTITGTNFTGATAVTIGGTAATNVVVASATSITAMTPAHAAGVVDVNVTTPSGSATGAGLYTYTSLPTVTSIAPNSGPATGGTNVTITGTNFTGATSVTIGGTAATNVTVANATTITATTPAHVAGVVDVTVTTPSGSATGAGLYTYSASPTVTSIAPNTGPATGGTSVTITGTNFTGATAVTIGGTAATNVVVTGATSITAITPAHAAGVVDVTVTTPNGSATGAGLYTYAVPATTTVVTSSKNPSEVGQAVTFTATVNSNGGTPSGSVVFNDGGTAIGTATLAGGVATLTTSALTLGSHTITAIYAGNAGFSGSTSPSLQQAVSTPQDSVNLRALQVTATKTVAQISGSAITGAIDTAISDGFGNGGGFITPSAGGMRFNFSADPDDAVASSSGPTVRNTVGDGWNAMSANDSAGRTRPAGKSRVDDAFAAIDRHAAPTKAPPLRAGEPKDWLFWADIRGAGLGRWGSSTGQAVLYGNQLNVLFGATRRVTPNLVIGAVGGYETFDYRSDTLNGRLKGDGWTIGSYLGWKFASGLRFDAAAAYSGIGYDGTAGTATGNFGGQRLLVSGGLIGSMKAYGFDIEPSAKVYALWEKENAYTDSLGTQQQDRTFFTGRASAGFKVNYPWLYSATIALAPFAGIYGDYYFTGDNAAVVALAGAAPLASVPLLDGWSARAIGGVAARFGNGAAVTVGAELGGLGSNVQIWTFRGSASLPFSAR